MISNSCLESSKKEPLNTRETRQNCSLEMLIRILAAAATGGDEAHDRPCYYTTGCRPGAFFFFFQFCNLRTLWFGSAIWRIKVQRSAFRDTSRVEFGKIKRGNRRSTPRRRFSSVSLVRLPRGGESDGSGDAVPVDVERGGRKGSVPPPCSLPPPITGGVSCAGPGGRSGRSTGRSGCT